MNPEAITVEDCITNYDLKGMAVIISDGRVIGFAHEKSPHRPLNQSGDSVAASGYICNYFSASLLASQ